MDSLDQIFYSHGHRYIYLPSELTALLECAGFTAFMVMRGGHYGHPIFKGADGHSRLVGKRTNEIEAVAIEACKPLA